MTSIEIPKRRVIRSRDPQSGQYAEVIRPIAPAKGKMADGYSHVGKERSWKVPAGTAAAMRRKAG